MKKKLIISLALLLFLSVNAQEVSQQDVQRFSSYYSNGMEYLKNQQYSSAISEFRKVLRFSPYDSIVQSALANAYYARGQYYRQTTKEVKKAITDYKSAYFYAKLWSKQVPEGALSQLANNCQKEIVELEKRIEQAQNIDSRLLNAKILRAQGELAASGYDNYQLLNSRYSEISHENLTNIYKNLNNISLAMDYAKETLDINPKNAKMHFTYGVMLDEAKNFEASMEQYNLALQYGDNSPELMEILENKWTQNIVNNPTNAQNYINLGAIYQKQGHYDGAKSQYLKAMQLDNSDDTAYYNLASLYIEQKNYQGAVDTYNKLLMRHPDSIEVLKYKAQALYDAKRYDEALKQYETILSLDSTDKEARQMSDDIIYNRFEGDKLLSYLGTIAANNPKNYEAQFNYAYELHKNKKYITAIEYYKKAQNINPSKEETYINLAQIYIEQKDYKKAMDISERGLMLMPENRNLKGYLADAKSYTMNLEFDEATKLYEAGKYKEALNKYLSLQEKNKDVYLAIAGCYWQMNDFKNANKYYLEILSKEPNNKDALVNSAYAYYSMNDTDNAKQMAQRVLALDKTDKEALEIISNIEQSQNSEILNNAIAQYEAGDYNNALSTVGKILSKKQDDEWGLYYKGLILDEMKKAKEAAWIYKTLIQKHPDFINAYYSLAVNLDNQENYKDAVANYEKFISLSKEKNDMTTFASSRVTELKNYLGQLNAKK
ncbi:MAG: tetratricopeptide repeat protein [Candidatus Gastranaerophilales bacterium]|nr:tetratricopeptide repeat protein [Candidatus Gastranaerophilales bacterium]